MRSRRKCASDEMAVDPAPYGSDQLFVPSNSFAKFISLLLPFLKFPLHGLNFAFGTPPFGASPDAQHSAAIGKPNTDGLIGYRFWIIDHVWLGSHFALGIESKRFHNCERRRENRERSGGLKIDVEEE
jgi:hypothetical protein